MIISMTSTWDTRFTGHPIWTAVDTLTSNLRTCIPDQGSELDHLNRLRKLESVLLEHKNVDQPKDFYTDRMLTSVHNVLVNSIIPPFETYANDREATSNLEAAAINCDGAFDGISGWPSLPAPGYAQAAGRAFKEYEKSAKSAIDELNDCYTDTRKKYENLDSQFQIAQEKIDGQAVEFTSSLEEREGQYLDAIGRVEVSGREAYDKAIRDHVGAQADHLTALAHTAAQATLATEDEFKKARAAREATEQAATWLSERAIATDFGKQARNKAVAGWIYDIAAAATAGVPLVLMLIHFLEDNTSAGTAISVTLARASVTIGALVIAGILFSRGATNHREARKAKSADIRLGTLEAFISKLNDDDAAAIRQGMAETIYLKGTLADEQSAEHSQLMSTLLDRRKKTERNPPTVEEPSGVESES